MGTLVSNNAGIHLEPMKKSDTAELRLRFDRILGLLAEGFNHKQICAYLNSEGLMIPYPQYRAIMARLRREKDPTVFAKKTATQSVSLNSALFAAPQPAQHHIGRVSISAEINQNEPASRDTPLVWNPNSEVKWK